MSDDSQLKILYTPEQISEAVTKLAGEISCDYNGKNLLVISILKGSFMFLADLVRQLTFSLEIDFMQLASYGSGTTSCGQVHMKSGPAIPVSGRHVLLVEDIIDTGLTTSFAVNYIKEQKPLSLKVCTLLDKPCRRQADVEISYCGITVPDFFLVGYGLDFGEQHRNLPGIYISGG